MSLNMSELGRELDVSRATVSLWKKDGMPVGSRESAVTWLAEHKPQYVEKLAGEVVRGGIGAPPAGGDGDLDGLDIHSTLLRFREIELRAWHDLKLALDDRTGVTPGTSRAVKLDAEISVLDKRYKSAADDRLRMEKRVADFELETGRRVSMDRVKELMNEKFVGLKVQIEALGAMESRNCNPDDPETAKRELNRWSANVLKHERGEGLDD